MPANSPKGDLDWVRSGSVVIFTGILGTGSIFGLRKELIHDSFTNVVFWVAVAAFALTAIIGMMLKNRHSLSMRSPHTLAIGTMLISLSLGLIGVCILCTLRNWR